MASLTGRWKAQPFVEANTFYFMDPDVVEFPPLDFTQTGMIAVVRGHAGVTTGTHVGIVDIVVEAWDGPPPVAIEDWQDAVECSLEWPGAHMEITGDSGVDEPAPVPITGPGTFRLRVYGRNRDDGEDREEDDPIEQYLIQLWQQQPAAGVTLKETSATAARLRQQAS